MSQPSETWSRIPVAAPDISERAIDRVRAVRESGSLADALGSFDP
jgi:hypothetical protein